MKSVILSIKPKYCELIASGRKAVEVRKTKPKIEVPFKCYIYCTNDFRNYATKTRKNEFWVGNPLNSISKGAYIGNGKVIGEFVCNWICDYPYVDDGYSSSYGYFTIMREALNMMCLDFGELETYGDGKTLFGWHISDLKIYDKPKEISEFKKYYRQCYYDHLGLAIPKCSDCKNCNLKRPPQSWCYIEELN